MLLWLESLKRRRLLRLSFLKSKIKNLSNFSCQIRIDEGIPFSWKEVNNKMCWCLCPSINQWVYLLLLFVFSSVLSETYVRKILNKNEVSEMVKDNYCVLKKKATSYLKYTFMWILCSILNLILTCRKVAWFFHSKSSWKKEWNFRNIIFDWQVRQVGPLAP